MKKIIVGLFALTILSTTGALAADKGKKKAKSKATTCCSKSCPETKDCKKTAQCPPVSCCAKS